MWVSRAGGLTDCCFAVRASRIHMCLGKERPCVMSTRVARSSAASVVRHTALLMWSLRSCLAWLVRPGQVVAPPLPRALHRVSDHVHQRLARRALARGPLHRRNLRLEGGGGAHPPICQGMGRSSIPGWKHRRRGITAPPMAHIGWSPLARPPSRGGGSRDVCVCVCGSRRLCLFVLNLRCSSALGMGVVACVARSGRQPTRPDSSGAQGAAVDHHSRPSLSETQWWRSTVGYHTLASGVPPLGL